jgi:hypothetical protein
MAAIASRSQIIEIESQVRPHFDGYLVIRVQMLLASCKASAQLREHFVGWRRLEPSLSAIPNHVRLPIAIHTTPAVALETKNPQPAMACVIPAFRSRAAAFVILMLPPAPM